MLEITGVLEAAACVKALLTSEIMLPLSRVAVKVRSFPRGLRDEFSIASLSQSTLSNPHIIMAKVKLNLRDKTDSELLAYSRQHIAAMSGNAHYAAPVPATAAFLAMADGFESAVGDFNAIQMAARQKKALKDTSRAALEAGLSQRGGYVEILSGGDESKILTSGLSVRSAPSPIGAMTGPLDFLATMGDKPGEVDLVWTPVRGAKSYIVQHSENVSPRVWEQKAVVVKSWVTIAGCTPGTVCVFRVAALGSAGQGPWSDETVKMSP